MSSFNALHAAGNVTRAALKFLPEPAITGVGSFNDVLTEVKTIGSSLVGNVDTVASGDLTALLNRQIEVQKEMQATTMASNIEKSKHESKMSAIRNIRVS